MARQDVTSCAGVLAETLPRLLFMSGGAGFKRPLAMGLRVQKIAGKVTDQCEAAVGNAGFDHAPRILRFPKERRGQLTRRPQLASHDLQGPLAVARRETLGKVVGPGGKLRGAREGRFRFLGGEAFGPHHRLTVVGLQLEPPPRRGSRIRPPRRRARGLVRHGDRLAEMGDRLLEGRAAQRLVARSSPPFDCRIVEPGLGEMMGDRLELGVRA